MIGIPIFAGFASKLLFATAAVSAGSQTKLILVMVVLAVSSLLNALYFIRTLIRIFSENGNTVRSTKKHGALYHISMSALIGMNLALGLFSWVFTGLIEKGLQMFA